MTDDIEVRNPRPGHYEIIHHNKILDTATTDPDAQIIKGKHKARLIHESLMKERDKLQKQLDLANEVIAGYHARIAEINKATRKPSPTETYLKDRKLG